MQSQLNNLISVKFNLESSLIIHFIYSKNSNLFLFFSKFLSRFNLDEVEKSKIGIIKKENAEIVESFDGPDRNNVPPNHGPPLMNQPGNHFIRGPNNNQNFRFGPPANNFMGQQQQQQGGQQFQQGPQMMQHPPPNYQQGPQFNQPRMMMNNFPQNQQMMSQGN